MQNTPIEWVVNVDGSRPGYSINPMTGCLNCFGKNLGYCGDAFPCYAYLQSQARCDQHDLKGELIESKYSEAGSINSFWPRFHRRRFQDLLNAPRGAGIFVNDRSDWAASYWPDWCQRMILLAARSRPDIRIYLLTKQYKELAKWSPYPDNIWVGVTITTNGQASLAFTSGLSQIKVKVPFISFEPLLGRIGKDELKNLATVSRWWIIGSQTKPYKPPDRNIVKEIIEVADDVDIPVFLKNNIYPLFANIEEPSYMVGWLNKPGELRQEMPK
jgi:protein gp37